MRPNVHFAEFAWLLRRFARDQKGVSAVEFAIILPFMLLLYIGSVEIGEGYQVQYQVTETARTVTDLASQYVSLNSSTMTSILNASSTIISPYSSANLTVTVSQVQVNTGATVGTVYQWSCSLNGTKRPVSSSVALPTNLQAPTSTIYLIYGEVSYPFTPPLGGGISGTITMNQTAWFYPRLVSSIAWTGTSC
jgi:Flp pilus assembly protein TadG